MALVPFGTGSLLWEEQFSYANNASMPTASGGVWQGPVATGDSVWGEDTGQAAGSPNPGWAGIYTAKNDFGDGDYIFNVGAWPVDGSQIIIHMLGAYEAEGGIDSIALNLSKTASANDRRRLQNWVNSAVTGTLIDNTATEMVNGDSIGIRYAGTLLQAWYKTAAGSWAQFGTDQTATAGRAGRVMMESNSGITRVNYIEYRAAEEAVSGGSGTGRKMMMMSGG